MRRIEPNKSIINQLRAEFNRQLREHLRDGTPYLFLDWPDYANVGDSALWLGGLTSLRAITGTEPLAVSSTATIDAAKTALPADALVCLSGGGNFGDLWKNHHENRIDLLRRFKNHRVIQLPQSIYFRNEDLIRQTAKAIADHGKFTLMTRDQESYEFACTHFDCEIKLTPDAAFGLDPLPINHKPNANYALLMRRDRERAQSTPDALALSAIGFVYDWTKIPKPGVQDRLITWLAFKRRWIKQPTQKKIIAACEQQSRYRLSYGLKMLQRGERVITDRLHGHILSLLLEKPHFVFDNSYGKTFSYIDTWYPQLSDQVDWRVLADRRLTYEFSARPRDKI